MSKYIIIDSEAIQKRIEELERLYKGCEKPSIQGTLYNQLNIELKEILSQSTPLIDEIEKAFDEGFNSEEEVYKGNPTGKIIGKKEYLSNLKLNI